MLGGKTAIFTAQDILLLNTVTVDVNDYSEFSDLESWYSGMFSHLLLF